MNKKIVLHLCHLYPDLLNLYGDRGNLKALTYRLKARGLDFTLTELPLGTPIDPKKYDLFFIGGGQDFEQSLLMDDLKKLGKDQAIKDLIHQNKTLLAICGGYQMLGNYYETWDGRQLPFIGALDFHSIGAKERMIGDFMFQLDPISGGSTVVGFENHSGRSYLAPSLSPLGQVLYGHGNNGEDKGEGLRFKNVFATYAHGPVLPKNPAFCDFILKTTLQEKYGDSAPRLQALPDHIELAAHQFMQQRLTSGKKQSSNF